MPRITSAIPEITVFLSSPSDVVVERQIIKRVIQEINADPAWLDRCVLKPLAYEDGNVPSQMGKPAQRVVDDFMRKSCEADIVVCIFCNRMGTPTVDDRTGEQYLSGSHYELDSAVKAYRAGGEIAPRIVLFLGSRDFPADANDEEFAQWVAARKFKNDIKSSREYEGLYHEYREPSILEGLIRIELERQVDQILASLPKASVPPTRPFLALEDRSAGPMRIYLSSTSEDLKSHRQAVLSAIRKLDEGRGRYLVIAMEDYSSQDAPPVDKCRQDVASCDVYVGLFAWRYGFIPDRHDSSITELEYRQAIESGLTVLPFLLAEDVPWVKKFIDTGKNAEKLQRFRGELTNRQICGFFTTPEGLAGDVVTSLLKIEPPPKPIVEPLPIPLGPPGPRAGLRAYLGLLAEKYRRLELQGIREAGSLRIDLEKVYVALKAEPRSEYDRRQAANLHAVELREAAGVDSLDAIDPAMIEQFDATVIRLTSRPAREEARWAAVTEVRTLGDAFREHRRMVILGGPGSGKTTLGRWLALHLADGLARQLAFEVGPEDHQSSPMDLRVRVDANSTFAFTARHFFVSDGQSDDLKFLRIEKLPDRGVLRLSGVAVSPGQVIETKQVSALTYTPLENQASTRYASFRFATGDGKFFRVPATAVIDVSVHVRVPRSQIDPDRPSAEELVDLGPARLPIFLRLAHFARELADRDRQQRPTIALINYLGHDPDSCGLADGLTAESRNALFQSYLEDGQAVVILDGLDELSEANRRTVVLKIHDFIEKPPFLDGTAVDSAPWEVGGNQVVVTSRYVGYKLAPIQGGCAHLGIQPMQRPAVERFARSWTDAVNVELAAEGQAGVVAERLIAEIYNDARPKVRELATCPLLVTILATVYWRDGRLPDQLAGVYDRVVENLIDIALKREECRGRLFRKDLLAALQPLAADMQENASSNGYISVGRIGEIVEGPLADLRNMKPDDPRFAPDKEALVETLSKHVGLLAEQSSGNYTFFHRTFQEFLAARHLLAHRTMAAAKIGDRIDDPLWRVPLMLALGFAMIDRAWGPDSRSRLLTDVLATDGPDALIPRAALLLVAALPDLRDAPAGVVGQTAVRLLTSYAISQDQEQAGVLREQIEQAFSRLRAGRQVDAVARQLAEALRRPVGGRDLAGATAAILRRLDWFTDELVEALLVAVPRDRADLDWPIHRALMAALGHRPASLPWLTPAPVLNTARLLTTHLPMRKLLESTPDLVALVRGDADWLCLVVALYGGIGDLQWLGRIETNHQQRLQAAQSPASPVPPVVVDPEPEPLPPIPTLEFSPNDIVHDLADPDLSRLIQRHLRARSPAFGLMEPLRQRWQAAGSPAGRAEALVGLAALGEDVLPLLKASLARAESQPAAQAALARFGWLRALLREPLLRSTEAAVRIIPPEIPEQHQLDLLRLALAARMASGGTPLPVSDRIPEFRYVAGSTPAVRDALEAEYWSYLFSGIAGEVRNASATFALVAEAITRPVDRLVRAWSLLPSARNHWAALRLPWPHPILASRADSSVECYLAMLDAMAGVPAEFHRAAGFALGRCRPLLEQYPDLAWETLAVCWIHGKEFAKGYRAAARRGPIDGRLMPDELEDDAPALHAGTGTFAGMSRIENPYLRFRALWQFLGAAFGVDGPVDLDVLEMVMRIPGPHDRIRAFEWILMTIPPAHVGLLNHIGLLDPMVQDLARITDPENRARAQCRLAFYAAEHLETLLHDAVESVGGIEDPVRKAAMIGEIRAAWGRTAGVADALDTLARTIPDPWERDKALGRVSRLVLVYRQQFAAQSLVWRLPADVAPSARSFRRPHPAGSLPWAIMYLDATAAEVEHLGETPVGAGAHWDRLLGADRAAAVAAITAAGRDGVPVTAREASILDRVMQLGEVENLDGLWPCLDRPDPGAMGIVARWSSRRDLAGQWSALVQAEGGRLTPEIVSTLIDLLGNSTDRLHHRAALALHGEYPYTTNKNRRWSVRQIGHEVMDEVARRATELGCPPGVLTALRMFHHDVHHDDPAAMEYWLAQAAARNDQSAQACWILSWMESIRSDLVPVLFEALASGPPERQQALLFGLARLAYCQQDMKWSSIHNPLSAVPLEVRTRVCVLPKGPRTVLEVAKQCCDSPQPGNRLQEARRLLESELMFLDDSCLENESNCLSRLKLIGSELYIAFSLTSDAANSYWGMTDKAAAPLAENAGVLELLLSWLATLDATADSSGYPHHILTATESVARFSPDAFASLAAPDFWEPILAEWAQYGEHWTARMAAVRLLGRLRRVTERVALALRAAMTDETTVQQAAYSSVSEFRRIEGDLLPELLRLIDDPSAGVAAATTQLLVGVAKAEVTPADRRRVLLRLEEAAARANAARPVYLMDVNADYHFSIRFVDRLDRILYRAIFDISGL